MIQKLRYSMGQKTNPMGNRLGIIEDGNLTGMEETIMVTNLPKTIRLENTFMFSLSKASVSE